MMAGKSAGRIGEEEKKGSAVRRVQQSAETG
jgi:hypothetical protein